MVDSSSRVRLRRLLLLQHRHHLLESRRGRRLTFAAGAVRARLTQLVLVVGTPPAVTLNGKPERLSPGARIRDADNRIVFANTLSGQQLVVNYVRENNGMVHEVWVLNAYEKAQPRAGASDMVIRNYRAASDADTNR